MVKTNPFEMLATPVTLWFEGLTPLFLRFAKKGRG